MRIAHFLWNMNLADGGVVRAVLDLGALLASNAGGGHEFRLLACITQDVPEAWKRRDGIGRGPMLVQLEPPKFRKTLTPHALEQATLAIRDADVVHIHGMWVHCNTQMAWLCQKLGKPYIWSPHGMLDSWPMSQNPLRKRVFLAMRGRRLLEGAAAVHFTTPAEAQQGGRWIGRGTSALARLPFDLGPYVPGPGPARAISELSLDVSRGPIVLYVGRLHEKKGPHIVLQAAKQLQDSGRACQVVLAGEGDGAFVAELHRLAAMLVPGSARFVGFVSGEQKASLYQAAAVMCLPTEQENFGYVVVEALAAGTPVITTKGVGLWSELAAASAAAECGTDAASVCRALEGVLTNTAATHAMANAGRAWCNRQFAPQEIAAGFMQMYQQALEQAAR